MLATVIDSCVLVSSASVGSAVDGDIVADCAHYTDCGHERTEEKSSGSGVKACCSLGRVGVDEWVVVLCCLVSNALGLGRVVVLLGLGGLVVLCSLVGCCCGMVGRFGF